MYTYLYNNDLLLSAIWKFIIINIIMYCIIIAIIIMYGPQIKSDQQLGALPARPSTVVFYVVYMYVRTYIHTYVLLYTYVCNMPVR